MKLLLTILFYCCTNIQAQTIRCFGDSFTQGLGVTGNYQDYPYRLSQILSYPTQNYGVGGATSLDVTARVIADSLHKSQPLIYWAGYNDFDNDNADSVVARTHRAINSQGHTRFIILSVMNNCSRPLGTLGYALTIETNLKLKHDFPNNFLDVRDSMVNWKSGNAYWDSVSIQDDVPNHFLMWDCVHDNAAGYNYVAQKVAEKQSILFNGTLGIRQLPIRARIRVPNGYFIYEIYTPVGQPLKAFTSATKFTKQEIFSNYPLGLYALGINGVYEWYYKR